MTSATRPVPRNSVEEPVFRDMCRRFAAAEAEPRWEQADRERAFPRDFFRACSAAGLIGISAPEAIGGTDLGCVEEAVCMEEVARVNPNLAVSILVQNVANALLYFHGSDVHREIAQRNITGECLLAIAVTEPEAGNDVQNVRVSARRDPGGDWIIDGIKAFITLGGEADVLVLLAQTDRSQGRRGMQFFAVDRASPGLQAVPIDTYVNRPAPTYRIMLDQVRVPEERRLAAGFSEIMAGFNRERIMVAARWLGHMRHAQEWALSYARERHQFGRPIGANQSIAFMLAQNQVDIEAAHHLTYHTAQRWDSGAPIRDIIMDVSTAKLFATQAVLRVTQNALHAGGGWGLTSELPVMRMAMDALVAPVTVGSYEIQLRAIARQLGLPCD
ncbi:acyl-CoA dehydrogenase family protein [Roseitalea porphyridii]|uniref:acyl-CoA dehydrogenase family protein n=1 Tax=Roseitalea porphyridii TaxID=1852022 RepID=UPI0032EB42F6